MSMLPSIYPLKPAPPKKRERRRVRAGQFEAKDKKADVTGDAGPQGLMDVGTWQAVRESDGVRGDAMGGGEAESLQVQLWMQSFHNEKERFQSVAKAAELFWARVLGATAELPEPNILRTAACMLLLQQIMCLFDRYGPLFNSLCAQLQTALFVDTHTAGFSKTAAYDSSTDPSLEALLPRRYVRQTYFSAYRELQVRYAALETQTASVQSNMNKLWGILDRSIRAWQRALKFTVFGQWRGVVVRQVLLRRKHTKVFRQNLEHARVQAAWRNWSASVDDAKLISAQKGVSEVGTTVDRLHAELAKLREELKEKQHLIEARDSRLAILVSENKQLKEEKVQAISKTVAAQKMCKRYGEMVGRWIGSFQQPKFDWLARQRAESLLTHPYGTHQFLLEWANQLIGETSGDDGKIVVGNFAEEVKTAKPYLYLLRALAPAQCSEGWVIRTLSEIDLQKRAAAVLDACKNLRIQTMLTPQDILTGSYELNYMFLAQLFRRFATFAPPFIRPPPDEAGLDEEAADDLTLTPPDTTEAVPFWDTTPHAEDLQKDTHVPQTPEDWDARWKKVQNMNRHWEARLAQVQHKLENELADNLRRSNKPTASKKQQEMQAEFAHIPMSSFLDVLTSVRGEYSPQEAYHCVVKVLTTHYQVLRRVFRYYCMADAVAISAAGVADDSILSTMSFEQFGRFLDDVGVNVNDRALIPNLPLIVDRVRNADEGGRGTRQSMAVPVVAQQYGARGQRLHPLEFSLALVYLARRMFPDPDLAERLRRLLVDMIEPNAKASASEAFRDEVRGYGVQAVMKAHEKPLLDLFLQYYEADDSAKTTAAIKEGNLAISLGGWKAFCQGHHLCDGTLTLQAAEDAFFGVQGEEEDDSSLTMSFPEFTEALCAVCLYKYPNAFEPFSQRLLRFFKDGLLRTGDQGAR
eukprot:TRINITY_DN11632_c0_g1_i1.p1 TRINITY_DN11632_c0_g1~~TRINITY_DN11632_c0_g1_i1.p1  ORF type:complete len:920 (+),score=369.80 TRINITY_DN11632_c0_g1_i1:62-2821(+)